MINSLFLHYILYHCTLKKQNAYTMKNGYLHLYNIHDSILVSGIFCLPAKTLQNFTINFQIKINSFLFFLFKMNIFFAKFIIFQPKYMYF